MQNRLVRGRGRWVNRGGSIRLRLLTSAGGRASREFMEQLERLGKNTVKCLERGLLTVGERTKRGIAVGNTEEGRLRKDILALATCSEQKKGANYSN